MDEHEIDYDENNEEEYSDDDYLIELHRRLQEMKNQRKKAEQDAALLDGRVRCLRGEEEKTVKKMEVVRKKTQDKILMIQQQQEEIKQKMAYKENYKKFNSFNVV